MTQRYVHLSARLEAALSLLDGSRTVADIGCDHGRLTAALLQQTRCERVIASDISSESLQKAKNLLTYIGLADRASFRVGDGLCVLREGEADAIAILGMGGTLAARLLDATPKPLCGASLLVAQPMRAQDDLRAYLHRNCYRIEEDRIIAEGKRLYQILSAVPSDTVQPMPSGWPEAFYDIGFRSFENRDPLLDALIRQQLNQHQLRLKSAIGTEGEHRLLQKITALQQIAVMQKERK